MAWFFPDFSKIQKKRRPSRKHLEGSRSRLEVKGCKKCKDKDPWGYWQMQLLAQNCGSLRLKPLKLNFLFGAKWALQEFWRSLGQTPVTPPICARQLWFLFFQAFCIWFKLGKTNVYAGLMQIIKLLEKRISALKFAMEQISDFKLSAGLSEIYHDQMDT